MARSVSGGSSATHIDRSRCPQEGGELRTPELTASLLRNGERKLVGRPRTFSDNGRTYLTKRADTHVLSIVSMVHIARPRRPPSLDFPRESAGVISIRRPVTVDARVDSSHDLVLKPLEITSPPPSKSRSPTPPVRIIRSPKPSERRNRPKNLTRNHQRSPSSKSVSRTRRATAKPAEGCHSFPYATSSRKSRVSTPSLCNKTED